MRHCALCGLIWYATVLLQEQRAWLIEQVEGLKPLPHSLARRALQALVSADAFERFLASSFPASKVRLAFCSVIGGGCRGGT